MSRVQILSIILSYCLVTSVNGFNTSPEFIVVEWEMESEDGSQEVPILT